MRSQNKFKNKILIMFGITVQFALLLMSCSISDPVDSHHQNAEAGEAFQYKLATAGAERFVIQGINGDMEITGVAGIDSVDVQGERVVRSDDFEDAEAHLALLTVKARRNGAEIDVSSEQPNRSEGRSYEVHYRVRLPSWMKIDAQLVNGEVTVEGASGGLSVALTNGSARCMGIYGNCVVALVNGPVRCDLSLPAQGACSLSTVNGNVSLTVPDTTSAQLEAKVTNGTISVSSLEVKSLKSSKTAVTGVLGTGKGTIQLSAVNGNVGIEGRK
jgi:hypothetical protein